LSELNGMIGEVVQSSTTRFRAVAKQVFEPPRFGSFVKVSANDGIVYGVVAAVETASFDSARRAMAFGMPWDQLLREQPQLIELIQTEFDAAVIGYGEGGSLHHYLPPYPPRLHDFVSACSPTEVAALTDSLEFVRTLAELRDGPVHELIAAAIREASLARGRDELFVAEAARAVAELFKDEYDLAMSIVRRIG
jgi:HAS barrel domain-containing protein